MTKFCFVTFSTDSYINIEKVFQKSVRRIDPNYQIFSFHTFEEIGSPTHKDDPYAFKIYAIEKARDLGYDVVIWCDSPTRLITPVYEWLEQIERVGVYLQKDGWANGTWANDRALSYFQLTRDEAMNISSIYACIMAFDFRHSITREFFELWKDCMRKGLFRGKWHNNDKTESLDERCRGHRHDQTCAELVAHKLNIELQPLVLKKYFDTWIDV